MTEEKLPLSMSVGTDNTTTLWCSYLEQRRLYGACLFLKDSYDAGRLQPGGIYDCANAMHACKCDAVKMREEEIKAGHALHYTPRTKHMQRATGGIGSLLSGKYNRLPETSRQAPTAKDDPKKLSLKSNTGSVAKVVTKVALEENEKSEAKKRLIQIRDQVKEMGDGDSDLKKALMKEAMQLKNKYFGDKT